MACGCKKTKTQNKNRLINKAKKTISNKRMPLITIRKRISGGTKKKAAKKG
jgi:hypothetical protein